VAITPGKPQRVDLGHSPPLGPLPTLDDALTSEIGGGLGGALAKHQRLTSVRPDSAAPVSRVQIRGSPAVSARGMTNASFQTVALTPSSTAGGLDSSAIQRDADISGTYTT
jgi:hypothetical protein